MKTKHFKSRHALLMSLTSLMLCVSMLFGATFAWFTDSVTSGVNRIVSGNLDVEVSHTNAKGETAKIDAQEKLFMVDIEGKDLLWEPEVISYETFKVSNKGTLALKYAMTLNNVGYNYVNGTNNWLGDVIQVAVTTTAPADRAAAKALPYSKTLSQFVNSPLTLPTGLGTINAGDNDQEFTIVLYWPQGVRNDNDYNLGHINGVDVKSSDGNPLYVNLGITLVATQESNENDSFGNTYDASADTTDVEDKWAGVAVASAAPTITKNDSGAAVATTTVAAAPTTDTTKQTTVTLTAVSNDSSAAFDQSSKLNLKVETNDVKASSSSTAFTVTDTGSTAVASIDLTLTKITTTNGVESDPVPLTSGFTAQIETYIAKNLSDVKITYKNDNGTLETWTEGNTDDAHKLTYNATSGELTFTTTHFSQYIVTSENAVAYIAESDTAYQTLPEACIAAAAAEGDVAVTLLRDAKGDGWSPDNAQTGTYTLDFAGHTYDVTGLVGSTNTRTQAWRVISGQTATLKNGTLTSSYAYMLINQYGNLTLDNMIVDGSKMPLYSYSDGTYNYTLSNNSGTTTIKNGTVIKVVNNGHAFDVYGSYSGKNKTIDVIVKDGVINGIVEFDKGNGSNSSLNISGGDFTNATFAGLEAGVRVSITGGTFGTDVSDYCAEGMVAIGNSNGTYSIGYGMKIGGKAYLMSKTMSSSLTYNNNGYLNKATITDAQDLVSLSALANDGKVAGSEDNGLTVTVANDIDMAGYVYQPPLRNMFMSFDGQNHTISNLTIGQGVSGKSGLLSYAGGSTIKDLTLKNVTASGCQAGAFVGQSEGTKLTNCTLAGDINITWAQNNTSDYVEQWNAIGAIIGWNVGVNITGMKIADNTKITLTDTGMASATSAEATNYWSDTKLMGSNASTSGITIGTGVTVNGQPLSVTD